MKYFQASLLAIATFTGAGAFAAEMSCAEIIAQMNREATPEAAARFKDLEGSCEGVVERDGELYMTTRMVIRRVSGNNITLYVPATDRTFRVTADPKSRVVIQGRKIRPRELYRGQELNLYVSVDEFTQPIIDQMAFATETDEIVIVPAVVAPALPTTG